MLIEFRLTFNPESNIQANFKVLLENTESKEKQDEEKKLKTNQ